MTSNKSFSKMPLIHNLTFRYSKFGFRGAAKLWKLALILSPYPSGWIRLPDGYFLEVDTKDWNKISIYQGLYDRPLCNLVSNLNFKGSFIDVGSNIGYIGFLACFGKLIDCLSIEPIMSNVQHQLKAFNLLNLKCKTINLAISDQTGTATLYGGKNPNHSGAASLTRSNLSDLGTAKIQTSTLNDIASQSQFLEDFKKPFFVKIDTEGAESKVITGMSSLFSLNHFLGLIIEVSPNFGTTEYLRDLDVMLGDSFSWILISEKKKLFRYRFSLELLKWNEFLRLNSQENLVIVKDLNILGNVHVR